VHYAGCTRHPSTAWVVQQARNLAWKLQEEGQELKFLLRDRDAKFPAAFDAVFRSEGPWITCFANTSITTSGLDRTKALASGYQTCRWRAGCSDADGW
jgi:hypothetical protein